MQRSTAAATALALALSPTLSACAVGQPHSFTARTEKSCASAARAIAADTPVKDPLGYAIDRFAAIDRLLVIVSTDRGFPGGTDGATLHATWIRPARTSLKAARPSLDTLRQVASRRTPRRARVFAIAARAGAAGVRTSTLRRVGLPQCAALFNRPVPPLAS